MFSLSRYRDFDWVLLGFVLLLSLISVLEIKSATLHTKFHGFDHKQIGFLAIGIVLMFLISLIDYHRLIDTVHWAYGVGILSLIAVGSGGVWGKGTNRGTQTQGDFLPIPYTDFIFAAFCEEHGFVGAIGVLLLYLLVLMRLIQNAQTASDLPGAFIIMGIVAVIVFQIAVNVGMVVGLMPVTGIPLPLMSYG